MRDDELEGWFTDWRPSFLESLIAAQKENLHSAALGWLLQAEELPLGGRVQLLEALGVPRIAETESISTRTEWDDIDVFVELEAAGRPLGIVAIENKLKASEHSEQLTRYDGLLANQQVLAKVFLTLTGEPAESGEGWRSASYSDLRRGLEGLKQACPEHRYLSDYCDVVSRAVAATRLVASVEAYSAFALKEDEPDASVSPGFVRYADHCGWGTVLGRIWMSAVGKLALQGVTLTRWHLRTSESRGDALLNLERVIERRGVRVRVGLELQRFCLKAFASPSPYRAGATPAQLSAVGEVMEEIREALLLGKGAKVSVPRSRGFRSFSLSAAIPPGEELRPTRWAGAIGEPLAALEAL